MELVAATEPKTYYSKKSALTISPGGQGCPAEFRALKGKYEDIGGTKERVGEHIIQFVPLGNANLGSYTTDDPLEIKYLDWRVATAGDIFGADKFYEETTPAEIQIRELKRQLTEQNRMLDVLKSQGKEPAKR